MEFIELILKTISGYFILNVGTYLICVFYLLILRIKDRSIGTWFLDGQPTSPKDFFMEYLVYPLSVILFWLPSILYSVALDSIEKEKEKEIGDVVK